MKPKIYINYLEYECFIFKTGNPTITCFYHKNYYFINDIHKNFTGLGLISNSHFNYFYNRTLLKGVSNPRELERAIQLKSFW
jgi:hypothetical protein